MMVSNNFNAIMDEYKDHLFNEENYGIYKQLVRDGFIKVFSSQITNDNLDSHFFNILNILKDGIETRRVHDMVIYFSFEDGIEVKLSIFYYLFNLIFWKLPLSCNDKLISKFLYFPRDLTPQSIKNYIDEKFLEPHQTEYDIQFLNNTIDDAIYKFKYVDLFHQYLLNTINNEDTIDLMNSNPIFYDYLHADLSNVPIENVKDVGMDITNKAIDIIKESDHCLKDPFRTGEGINKRQYKEYTINIGSKPDGFGGVYPHVINSSFCTGGLQSKEDLLVDSGSARFAQIMSKENVGDSGHFSRILGLNNQGSRLHNNPRYICNTKHFLKVKITDKNKLNRYKNRYYRFTKDGIEHKISSNPLRDNLDLIGKTLLFRSPVHCASASRGDGICYRCYGDLAYVNYGLSIGKLAAEILCAILTQMLLSAKHLLETMVIALKWVEGFNSVMEVHANMIAINQELENLDGYILEIPYENLIAANEYDNFDYNIHMESFNVIYPDGNSYAMHTENNDPIYISNALMPLINELSSTAEEQGFYRFNFNDLKDMAVFMVKLSNADISRALDDISSMILNSTGFKNKTIDEAVEQLLDAVIEGKVNIDAVHLEVLLSNQIRVSSKNTEILETPRWEFENARYEIIGLKKALSCHPSITTTLTFERISQALYNPLNFKKRAAHSTDLFFMVQPQELRSVETRDENTKPKSSKLFEYIDMEEE